MYMKMFQIIILTPEFKFSCQPWSSFTINFIFSRMDENKDGNLTEEEFLKGCLQDDELSKMLAPNVAT